MIALCAIPWYEVRTHDVMPANARIHCEQQRGFPLSRE